MTYPAATTPPDRPVSVIKDRIHTLRRVVAAATPASTRLAWARHEIEALEEVVRLRAVLAQYADRSNWAYIGDLPGQRYCDWRWHFSIGPDDHPADSAAQALGQT